MPDRPIGLGDPIEIDIEGEIGAEGNREQDIAPRLRDYPDATVVVSINSEGGSLTEANRIFAVLARRRCAVFANIAQANSAAALIALAADVRSVDREGSWLLHPPTFNSLSGTFDAKELQRHAQTLEGEAANMAAIIAARTGQPREVALKWLAEETVFDAGAAVAAGLANHISSDRAPMTPAAIRARFRPIDGPYSSFRPQRVA